MPEPRRVGRFGDALLFPIVLTTGAERLERFTHVRCCRDAGVIHNDAQVALQVVGRALDDATAAAERLCRSISEEPISIAGVDEELPITISIGVAAMLAGSQPLELLIKRADAALYEAKDGGRNRVAAATGMSLVSDLANQAASG